MTPADMRRFRGERGWSQSRLGEELDVTKQTIINWEKGHKPISRVAALALQRVFDASAACQCPPAKLIGLIRKIVRE